MKTGLKILSVLMIIIGVLALFIGLPIVVLMLGATAFAMCVIALLLDFSVQSLCGSIVPLLYLICASAVRKSA